MTDKNDNLKEIIEAIKKDEDFINYIINKVLEQYPVKFSENNVYNNGDEFVDYSEYVSISNIKELLKKIGEKPSWLQKKTKIPMSTLRSIINNTNETTLTNAFKISKVLKLPIEVIFQFIEKK